MELKRYVRQAFSGFCKLLIVLNGIETLDLAQKVASISDF